MSSEERSFKENLDLLIKLFKKLKDKTDLDHIPGIDKNMYQNFDLFLKNYETMRDQISDELLMQFGEPMKKMIADLVEQLKGQLDEEIEEESIKTQTESKEIKNDISKIDELLKNPNLSEEDIDKLLDQRSRADKNSSDNK